MQIMDLRSIVTDVRRLTLQIINGHETTVFETSARDGNKYPLLPLSRFTLQKLKNASAAEYGTRIAIAARLFIALCSRSLRRIARGHIFRIDVIFEFTVNGSFWIKMQARKQRSKKELVPARNLMKSNFLFRRLVQNER